VSMVVADSTPLINLAAIHRFNLLRRLYEQIVIPRAVYQEVVVRGQGRAGANEVRAAVSTWISIAEPEDTLAVDALAAELARGEAEAIILAKEQEAQILLIDEIRGRRIAKQLGLKVRGTLGVLSEAKHQGLVSSVKEEMDRLRSHGAWIHQELYELVLRLVGEA